MPDLRAEALADLTARAHDTDGLPQRFGKYVLLRRLALGGMAELFIALQRSAAFEKLIVIKRILPEKTSDELFVRMLLKEARIAATLNHPNIVQTFDAGDVDGRYYIAMEHVHGEDLRAVVRGVRKSGQKRMPLEHALAIVLGVCAGLAHAHEKRGLKGEPLDIVHRDVTPHNVVVSFAGDVKLVDFGIAKGDDGSSAETTQVGQIKGKAPYMSPEQALGMPIDARSDLFAVGILLFELSTGKRLFKASNDFETLKLIVDSDYPTPSQVDPDYPPALEWIVMKALARKPEHRYQTARELLQDLEAFVREERLAVTQSGLASYMRDILAERAADQDAALQDLRELVDTIHDDEPVPSGGSGPRSLHVSSPSIPSRSGITDTSTAVTRAPESRSEKLREQLRDKRVLGGAAAGLVLVVLGVRALSSGPDAKQATGPSSAQPTAAPVEPARERGGSIRIESDPPGCDIWINGQLRKEQTPATLTELPLYRQLDVKLTKEGLEPFTTTVSLNEKTPHEKLEPSLRKGGSVTVVLKVEPTPTIWLDGKPYTGSTDKLEGLSAGEEHKLVLSAPGHASKTVAVKAYPGDVVIVSEKLEKVAGAATTSPATGAPPGASTSRPSGKSPWEKR
jgi:serine/threonine protein kinase